ncbi:Coatomer subunit delta [Aphelenchoides bicaudatus]|nr:Coatomer subunit delta [Aphelenchoides bicaudatus]
MVLIAASVFTKSGKCLLSRQFVSDMTRARLEGLLDAFPKLIGAEKNQRQHTFVETESVRYVYQPLDQIYMVLITTTNSNILEDLETLRLFSRIIPEYCHSNEEAEILKNVFELIFAFDEVVAFGYRESVNLAQIRTFTEMDSHEERVFNQIQIAQQRAAKNNMQEKIKEMKREKKKAMGGSGYSRAGQSLSSSGSASQSYKTPAASSDFSLTTPVESSFTSTKSKPKAGGGKALKLGGKSGTEDIFCEQLRQEGQQVNQTNLASLPTAESIVVESNLHREKVHLKSVEKVSATVKRDGVLESAELFGSITLNVTDPEFNTVAIQVNNNDKHGSHLQVHPNLDKNAWQKSSTLRLKSAQKPFPTSTDVGILKWRLSLKEEDSLPLALNVWPNESSSGCTVNIEYTLQQPHLTLNNVKITVPLPTATAPIISECEGSYEYLRPKNILLWTIPLIDNSNKNGSLEFEVPNGDADHFFPVNVLFSSEQLYCQIGVESVSTFETNEPIEFSSETRLVTDKYEII